MPASMCACAWLLGAAGTAATHATPVLVPWHRLPVYNATAWFCVAVERSYSFTALCTALAASQGYGMKCEHCSTTPSCCRRPAWRCSTGCGSAPELMCGARRYFDGLLLHSYLWGLSKLPRKHYVCIGNALCMLVCMPRVSSGNKCFCCTAMPPLAVRVSAVQRPTSGIALLPTCWLAGPSSAAVPALLCCCGSLTACKQLLAGHFLQVESTRQCCNLLALAVEADWGTMPGVRQATASSPAWFCLQQLLWCCGSAPLNCRQVSDGWRVAVRVRVLHVLHV